MHLKPSREITQKVKKQELLFLYATYCHDLFYITVKYNDYIPKGIQVTEGTRIRIKIINGEITKQEGQEALNRLPEYTGQKSNIYL